jgi:hypothetical protein
MSETERKALEVSLVLAVYGPHATAEQATTPLEDLLWQVGQYRREIEAAHHWCDMQGTPREQGGHPLTVRGRLDTIGRTDGR